jgi:23S rRNA (cytidine1920-2'-O)/16S rRNA (cytidine1409-2'-O)-methyltransferase
MATTKVRIDRLLVDRGLYPSRERAQAALMAGIVKVAGLRVDKAGTSVPDDAEIEIQGPDIPFVSRGGLKLEKALNEFGWDVTGARAVDLGASTGGFTDCLLQRGAAEVVAVDVGRGQLHQKLRNDSRVHVLEKVNARHLTLEQLPYRADFLCADVSFISIQLVLPNIACILQPSGRGVTLIKPQFEAGREQCRKGVVLDAAVHHLVLTRCCAALHHNALELLQLTYSPVRGPAGNIEFLAGFAPLSDNRRESTKSLTTHEQALIDRTVTEAHHALLPTRHVL